MIKNKIFTAFILFIFCFTLPKISFAQEQETFDYEQIPAGSCVTKDGFFFTEDGMVKLVVNTQEKIKLITLESQKQVDLVKIDLKKCSESKESELRIQKQMYEAQLLIKQQALDAYKSEAFWRNIQGSAAGLVLGVVLGIGIYYFATTK